MAIDAAGLDALFLEWNRSDQPGVTAGISHPTAGPWRRGYGLASVEIPVANTPRTLMRIGSVTKMFTGLGVLLLAEQGCLSLDDRIRRYLPELPPWADRISLRHLMTHTSGMRCYLDLLFNTGNAAKPMPQEVALSVSARQTAANFPPGAHFCYSNGGYDLLALIVERVSNRDFSDFLRTRLFAPIGMHDSVLKRSDSEMIAGSASLHVKTAGGGFERGFFGAPLSGGGGIVSTVDDMLRWLAHAHHPQIGNCETWRTMLTPGTLDGGRSVGYSAGLNPGSYDGFEIAHHSGAVMGGLCMCATLPELELDVIVIANRDDVPVMRLAQQMIDQCVGGAPPRNPARKGAQTMGGTYHAPESGTVLRLSETDGAAELTLLGMTLGLVSEGAALVADDRLLDLRVEPVDTSAADLREIRLVRQGGSETFLQLPELPREKPAPEPLCGEYRCEDVEATAAISVIDGRCKMRLAGPYGREDHVLEPLSERLWVLADPDNPRNFGASLEFAAGAGSMAGFHLSTGRTWRLPFVRLGGRAP